MKKNSLGKVLRAFLLSVPIFLLYAAHFLGGPSGESPTGFIQDDMPYYVANARQYLDGHQQGVLYSNPYDFSEDSPAVYFQPFILAVRCLLPLSFGTPCVPLLILGGVSTVAAFAALVVLVERLTPDLDQRMRDWLTVVVAWGGGSLAILGVLFSALQKRTIDPFLLDPTEGLWFLNFGRNFVYPTEAFYHLVVVLLLLAVLSGSKGWVLVWGWTLAVSHPFTGMQYALIVLCWSFLELRFWESGVMRWKDLVLFASPAVFCFVYYLAFLPQIPSHRLLMDQWTLDWSIKYPTILGAYWLVGGLAVIRCRTSRRFAECFADPFHRFLGISFALSFVLANHEAFLAPRQPIHFTRGHIWLPLCLLGLPVLADVGKQLHGFLKPIAILCFGLLIFSDNLVFFGLGCAKPRGIYLSEPHREVLTFLAEHDEQPIVVSENELLAYLSATYSSARPYVGHFANTPGIAEKRSSMGQFFEEGKIPPELNGMEFWVITERHADRMESDGRFRKRFGADGIEIYSTNGLSKE